MKTSSGYQHKWVSVLSGVFLLGLSAGNLNADGVNDMCVDSDKICECAARKLNTEVGQDAYALYEAVGAAYLVNKDTQMNMVEAWDAAVKAAAEKQGQNFSDVLSKTNKIGSTHREFIEACKGS